MRILMIGNELGYMRTDLMHNTIEGQVVHKRATCELEFKDGTFIKYHVVRDHRDVERLYGLRFDMIVEHPTFRGSPEFLQEIRAHVLR